MRIAAALALLSAATVAVCLAVAGGPPQPSDGWGDWLIEDASE